MVERKWCVELGPNKAGIELPRNLAALRAEPAFADRQRAIDELKQGADRPRAQAKDLDNQAAAAADVLQTDLKQALEERHGPAYYGVRGIIFQVADEQLEQELVSLTASPVAKRLLSRQDGERVRPCGGFIEGDMILDCFAAGW